MMNGCICCTVRQDLVVVLKKIAKRMAEGLKIDAVVIETTGM
jgi:G3E family GTPase